MEFSGQYLTYNEYRTLGGTLDLTPFNLLEYEARRKIDKRTQNRLNGATDLPQEVKMCVFSLINSMSSYDNKLSDISNKNIASERVGSHSVSYISGSQIQDTLISKTKELDDIIDTYLMGVVVNNEHIMYLGVN